jgi:hypothetical protein
MNNERRKLIAKIIDELGNIPGTLEDLSARVEEVRDAEQEYYDNMPEGLQAGDKGETAQAAIDALEAAYTAIGEIIASIEETNGNLETASE